MSKREDIVNLFMTPLKKINPAKALMVAIGSNEQGILRLNDQQLDRGLDADGKSLGKYKNYKYKNRFEPIDLKLTGEFRRKESIGVDEKKTEFFSQDWKAPMIEKRWPKALGLTFQNLVIMGEIIKPDFDREVKNQLTS
jgi:hypothetical protein